MPLLTINCSLVWDGGGSGGMAGMGMGLGIGVVWGGGEDWEGERGEGVGKRIWGWGG